MRAIGTRLVCDRCGSEDFTTQILDHVNYSGNSDSIIDNALVAHIPGWGIRDGKELCKCCKEEYDRRQQEFFSNRL